MNTGEVYGKYRLVERIASGGMAEVFKGVAVGEAGFEKPVAIKRLHRRMSEDEDLVAMLQDEARLCSKLNHGNICQVLDLGRVGDTYYIAMEFVNGKDLFDVLRRASQTERPLPLPGALYVACEMLAGLDYAHRKRGEDGHLLHIIHRDISPQNVLITWDGEVKIIDFGIAKARGSTHKTQAGIIKGKFRYMSPEQARGEPIDHRTDIFAAGVVLYEMITGRPHAAGATDREILIKIQTGKFDRLREIMPSLPADLEEMVHRALAVNPDHRWSSARAFRKSLMTFMRMSRLSYSRDELAEYIRYLFKEDTGQDTSIETLGAGGQRDHLPGEGPPAAPAGFAAPDADPFSIRAHIPDLSLDASAAAAPPPAESTVSLQREAAAEPAPKPRHKRKASRQKPTQKIDTQPPPAAAPDARGRDATARVAPAAAEPAAASTRPRRGTSSVVVAIRWLGLLAVLGAMGLGGYYIYVLYVQRQGGIHRTLLGGSGGTRRRRAPRAVKATLEIDSRPRGARILLAGQDTGVKTPGRFPDVTTPTRLLVELRHPYYKKTPWKRILPVQDGDTVRFTADLRNPPAFRGKAAPRGRVHVTGHHGDRWHHTSRAPPNRPARPMARESSDEARLVVTSNQQGAQVLINGKVRGRIPLHKRVRPATFSVQVISAGARSDVRVVTLSPGQIKRLHFHLGQ